LAEEMRTFQNDYKMLGKKSKVSKGLVKLLEKGKNVHFNVTNDIFIEDPSFRVRYVELFNHAQVVEIAQSSK